MSSTYSPETPFDNTCRWSPSPARSPQPRRSSTPRATRETSRSTRRPSRSSRRTSSSNRRADIDLVSGATMTGQEGGLVARHGHRGGSSAWRPRLPCRAWRRACNQGSCLAWSDLSSPAGSDTTVKRAARAGPPASGRVSSDGHRRRSGGNRGLRVALQPQRRFTGHLRRLAVTCVGAREVGVRRMTAAQAGQLARKVRRAGDVCVPHRGCLVSFHGGLSFGFESPRCLLSNRAAPSRGPSCRLGCVATVASSGEAHIGQDPQIGERPA